MQFDHCEEHCVFYKTEDYSIRLREDYNLPQDLAVVLQKLFELVTSWSGLGAGLLMFFN